MTQADRDRLVTLRKAKKKLITQRQAAEEPNLSVRHIKRLLCALKPRAARQAIEPADRKEDRCRQRNRAAMDDPAQTVAPQAGLLRGFGQRGHFYFALTASRQRFRNRKF